MDLADDLSVLSINTLYFNKKTSRHRQEKSALFSWLKKQLKDGRRHNRKFIVTCHIFPGMDVAHKKGKTRPLR